MADITWFFIGLLSGFGIGVIFTTRTLRAELKKRIARMEAGNGR